MIEIKEEKSGVNPEPSLNDVVEHMKKHGGYLKGRGSGRVKWVSDGL